MAAISYSLTVETQGGSPIAENHPDVIRLALLLHTFFGAVALASLEFSSTGPNTCHYDIVARDGRRWQQDLTFAGAQDQDPAQTFDVDDGWHIDEFEKQREVRRHLIAMRANVKLVSVTSLWQVDP